MNAVGLPVEDAALIIVIDWLIDRTRTMLNVLGDAVGSAIVDHLSRDEMAELDKLVVPNAAVSNGINSTDVIVVETENEDKLKTDL